MSYFCILNCFQSIERSQYHKRLPVMLIAGFFYGLTHHE
jgi:hypothetical protein